MIRSGDLDGAPHLWRNWLDLSEDTYTPLVSTRLYWLIPANSSKGCFVVGYRLCLNCGIYRYKWTESKTFNVSSQKKIAVSLYPVSSFPRVIISWARIRIIRFNQGNVHIIYYILNYVMRLGDIESWFHSFQFDKKLAWSKNG